MTCGVRNVGTSSKPAAINSISPKDYDNRKPFELVSCEIVYLLFGTSVKRGQPQRFHAGNLRRNATACARAVSGSRSSPRTTRTASSRIDARRKRGMPGRPFELRADAGQHHDLRGTDRTGAEHHLPVGHDGDGLTVSVQVLDADSTARRLLG